MPDLGLYRALALLPLEQVLLQALDHDLALWLQLLALVLPLLEVLEVQQAQQELEVLVELGIDAPTWPSALRVSGSRCSARSHRPGAHGIAPGPWQASFWYDLVKASPGPGPPLQAPPLRVDRHAPQEHQVRSCT